MVAKNMILAFMLLSPLAPAMKTGLNGHPKMTLNSIGMNTQAVAELEKVFVRSEEAHDQSMEEISKSLTLPKAIEVIQKSTLTGATSVKQISDVITGTGNLRAQSQNNADGFGGLDGARLLLNDMIYEASAKYDAEIAKCTEYYSQQCALMEVARGQIAAANFVAANSRSLILDAQTNINRCTKSIPETKQELAAHKAECKTELDKMDARLKIIMGDIEIMTMILEMSDCDAKLVQMERLALLRCRDQCTMKDVITFNHNKLQDRIDQLHSPASRELVTNTFQDLFEGAESVDSAEFVQVPGSEYLQLGEAQDPELPPKPELGPKNKTKFNRPPVPRTAVPSNPCANMNPGPASKKKRGGKCTLKKSPNCYKLQGRFLQIQAEIADSRDQLMDEIEKLTQSCKDTEKTLTKLITDDGDLLLSSQGKLAAATEKESAAGETGRQVAAENQQYNDDLLKQMHTCQDNYKAFENEICALGKIRGDLFKKKSPGHSGFFQDCQVTKWVGEACTKKCAGGEQKIVRDIASHAGPVPGKGGAKCLPLSAERSCNRSPCPIDCALEAWTGWGKCSSKCGGGVQSRVRDVKMAMKYNGKPCGPTSETRQCNTEACEKNCELHEWTKWTTCSKDCDGGSKKRERSIRHPAEGSGTCASQWDPTRLQYKQCNEHRCRVADATKALKCNNTLDIMLLLDATPKSEEAGWAAEVKAANMFVDAFTGDGITAKPNFAVIHYTGPRTWAGVSKCTGKSTKDVDMEKDCHITIASHFEEDVDKVKGVLNGLQYQPGSKLLSLALMTAQAELALGRKTERTVVVVFIDGQPLSYRKTLLTSLSIRKKARLVWVPVTKFSPLKDLKQWASRRWQENLVTVSNATKWGEPEVATHIVANICPKRFQKLVAKRF